MQNVTFGHNNSSYTNGKYGTKVYERGQILKVKGGILQFGKPTLMEVMYVDKNGIPYAIPLRTPDKILGSDIRRIDVLS
ncbi:MAG: hypothetical protein QE263_03130 [Vampirovibrionales bacterium]|nr:hypothetical protein [Vampirovibrionales bacterium]